MRRLALAVALTCLVSATTLAGSIPTGDIAPPPPPPEIAGSIPTGDVANPVLVELIVTLPGLVA